MSSGDSCDTRHELVIDTLAMDEGFPKLLANPALLTIIEQSLSTIGLTYGNVINHIVGTYNACNDTYEVCKSKVVDPLVSYYENVDKSINALTNAVVQELHDKGSNVITHCSDVVDGCLTDLDTLKKTLPPNCLIQVEQTYPTPPDPFNFPFTWQQWLDWGGDSYWIDGDGHIQFGYMLNSDGSWLDGNGFALGWADISPVNPNLNLYTLPGPPGPPPPSWEICNHWKPCPPTPTIPVIPIIPPVIPIIPTIPTIPTCPIPPQCPPQIPCPIPPTIPTNDCCPPQPAPIVNVTVLPAPVKIITGATVNDTTTDTSNVESSNITSGPIAPSVPGFTTRADSNPEPITDVVKNMLAAMGYEQKFIDYFGNLVDDDEMPSIPVPEGPADDIEE